MRLIKQEIQESAARLLQSEYSIYIQTKGTTNYASNGSILRYDHAHDHTNKAGEIPTQHSQGYTSPGNTATAVEIEPCGSDPSNILERIHAFSSAMGVALSDPINTEPWERFLLAAPNCPGRETEADGGLEHTTRHFGPVKLGNLLRQIEGLNPGKLSIIDLATNVTSARVRPQGMGKVVFPLVRGDIWSIVSIGEDHCQATMYLKGSTDTRAKSKEYEVARVVIADEFKKVYRRLFPHKAPPQQHIENACIADYGLCYLLTAFAVAMDVIISTPCREDLWRRLFHRMAQTKRPGPHVLWIGIPAVEKIEEADHISVPLCYADLKLSQRDSFHCLSEEVVCLLQAVLGSPFIQHLDAANFIIHQSVLMMLFVSRFSHTAIEFCRCPSAAEDLIALIQMMNPSRLVVFMTDSGFSDSDPCDTLFDALRFFDGSNIELSVYPSKEELVWSRNKLGDIRTFDTIARTKHQWRPKTCFGMGDCALPDVSQDSPQAIKRNHSCAAADVEIVTRRDAKLKCATPAQVKTHAGTQPKGRDPGYLHFHQQRIPTFQDFGEFRVFVCAGKVMSIMRTNFEWQSAEKNLLAWKAGLDDFNWYSSEEEAQMQKRQELEQFVLGQDEHIRQQQKPEFRTIHIGARYDVGITEKGPNGQFFMNELTRLLSADTFPKATPFPNFDILLAWAREMARLVAAPCLKETA
ncbi:hypothetical protein NQ176_g719 [Zarea fungicola]|uniref:Uncharacterized protein n=1 Tax=Zarea fungicola TaxID=93591 RepID=A0ACC1NWS6_9HYPO|nr:hypothetical protein NQ176_g719 [Lecanicillium fungicola]